MSQTVFLTALQAGLARAEQFAHPIPPITDPMGRNWQQPSRFDIEVDEHSALMNQRTFEALKEYSASMPSAVYPGKMWKRHDGAFDAQFLARGGSPEWLLCWYGYSDRGEGWCSNNFRKILLVDEASI